VAYTIYNLTRLEALGVKKVILFDQVTLLSLCVIFWLAHTRRVPSSWVHFFSAAIALGVAGNTALSIRVYSDPSDLVYMTAAVVAGAAVVVSVRWLVLVIVGTAVLGVWAALGVCSPSQLTGFIGSQVAATVVAVTIYAGRIRGLRKLLKYRLRDAQTTRELKVALETAEREFRDHETTERQKRELQDQLRQAQKLEALGTLAGGVAHDINNVIGAITAIASTTIRELSVGAEGRKELKQILVAARRGTTLTRNLVRFARQEPPRNEPFILDDVVVEVDSLLRRTLDKRIEINTVRSCAEWAVLGDAGLVGHALMNLCLNSADAIENGGRIDIETRKVTLDASAAQPFGIVAGDYVELSVRDDGCGMSPEVLERAFEPFFSTKENKKRSGLGLPMVYGTIQQHSGGLKVESRPGGGTTVRIVLPAFEKPEVTEERKRTKSPAVDSLRTVVLFVDDESLLRKAGKRMLMSLGYEVLLASDGKEALEKFQQNRHRIGAVVLDVAMPVMNGAECCRELRRIDPQIPVVLASGFPKGEDLQPLLSTPNTRYLRKPYELDDLGTNLAELGEAFSDLARFSCQVHCVRISTPSQKNAVSIAPSDDKPEGGPPNGT
jgi:signal transduction histidine kinase/CheY-like chemotaxis protein